MSYVAFVLASWALMPGALIFTSRAPCWMASQPQVFTKKLVRVRQVRDGYPGQGPVVMRLGTRFVIVRSTFTSTRSFLGLSLNVELDLDAMPSFAFAAAEGAYGSAATTESASAIDATTRTRVMAPS